MRAARQDRITHSPSCWPILNPGWRPAGVARRPSPAPDAGIQRIAARFRRCGIVFHPGEQRDDDDRDERGGGHGPHHEGRDLLVGDRCQVTASGIVGGRYGMARESQYGGGGPDGPHGQRRDQPAQRAPEPRLQRRRGRRRRPAASRSTSRASPLDRRRMRHGAPSTISAGPTMAKTQNWIDWTNRYRCERTPIGGTRHATMSTAPVAASQWRGGSRRGDGSALSRSFASTGRQANSGLRLKASGDLVTPEKKCNRLCDRAVTDAPHPDLPLDPSPVSRARSPWGGCTALAPSRKACRLEAARHGPRWRAECRTTERHGLR
jgi:hypothetical protein